MDGSSETALVGRCRELDEVLRLLESARLVTLTGAAGIGKSRLAVRAAQLVRERFPDGARLVRLSRVHDPRLLPQIMAEALGLGEDPGRSWDEVVLGHLAGRRMLLIVDACEHLVTACADFVRTVLRVAPEVRVLATGRRRLRVAGEHALAVGPLEPDEALGLFVSKAAVAISAADVEKVRTLCLRLECVPLAIELAAHRLRTLPLDDLLARMHRPLDALAEGPDVPSRPGRDLRAAIRRSHELCTPAERLLWARLSVFAGEFDLDGAEAVCSDDDLPPDAILGVLAGLVQNSIVIPEKDARVPRFRMLHLIREHGREQLEEWGGGPDS
ncbi:ATP-binding protein [Actinomadura rubrisoli]|uniref:AAA family ATPase n=1 Tax=Actinomadura rubrisoli TaxID=2530368 RepID=A0A4R5B231_9ACTN|nr:hypothetical protein [Actinomadura rubrisoli]TDD79205.1 hypothetical protein E1298_28310 [Actinomadura rubrisoli]